jgi:hypothetical protein
VRESQYYRDSSGLINPILTISQAAVATRTALELCLPHNTRVQRIDFKQNPAREELNENPFPLFSPNTLNAFIVTVSRQFPILYLPLAAGQSFVKPPEFDSINHLNTESYGITVAL